LNVYGYAENKPNPAKECAICHYEWMPEFIYQQKSTDIASMPRTREVANEKMCFSCHNGTVGDSRLRVWSGDRHQSVVKPNKEIQIPKELPLENNKIVCKTCHSAHSTGEPKKEDVKTSIFLRIDNKNGDLCKTCHKSHDTKTDHPQAVVKSKDIESRLNAIGGRLGANNQVNCMSCHIPHSPMEQKLLIYPIADSRICSICHIDKIDKDYAYKKGLLNHPINIKLDDRLAVEKIKNAKGILAKNNEIICLSCHTPHKSENRGLTVINNNNSELCFVCHKDKNELLKSKHDMTQVAIYKTKKDKTVKEVGVCGACHDPHGWSLELPDINADLLSKACLSCHTNEKYVKKQFNYSKFSHPVGKEVKTKDVTGLGGLVLFNEIKKYFTFMQNQKEKKLVITCATCHDIHTKKEFALRVEAKTGTLCLECHKEKDVVNKTEHGKNKLEKACLSCHKIHESDNKRLLIGSKNDGCLECHNPKGLASKTAIVKNSHPVEVELKGKSKLKLKLLDDKFVSCITCHDPHAETKKPGLKNFAVAGIKDYGELCSSCHDQKFTVANTSHDMREKNDNNTSVCFSCHMVHNANSEKYVMKSKYNYKEINDYCIACHNKDGSAKKKVVEEGHKIGEVSALKNVDGAKLTKLNEKYFIYCNNCHDPHINGPKKGEEGTFSTSYLKDGSSKDKRFFCVECHKDKNELINSKHNPEKFKTADKDVLKKVKEQNICGICHNTHDGKDVTFKKLTIKDIDKICLDCHQKGKLGEESPIFTSHMVGKEIKSDNKYYQISNIIGCITCHEPHKSNQGMLRFFNKEFEKRNNICLECHDKKQTVTPTKHNMYNLDVAQKARDVNKFFSRNNECYFCHVPHNFDKNNRVMFPFENKSNLPAGEFECLACHTKNGLGGKKIVSVYNHDRIFKIFPLKEKYKDYLYTAKGDTSPDGSIICYTCHDPHKWDEKGSILKDMSKDGDKTNSFLKTTVKNDFCKVCHGDGSVDLFDKFHDEKFRQSRDKKAGEREVLIRMMILQQQLDKDKGKNK
jgi:predicted CXXCH cytochrome family protein